MNVLCAISDSGTISEEFAILQFPAISLHQSMEQSESQDNGNIILTGFEPYVVLSSIKTVIAEYQSTDFSRQIPVEYKIENTSWRALQLIMGNTKFSNMWWRINAK